MISETDDTTADGSTERAESTHRGYILDVRIVECPRHERPPEYRFEAPAHGGLEFEDPDAAELYADVYFDVNGFEEAGTGERGVPPEIIQAGRDTLVAYFLTQPRTDVQWVASYYGEKPEKIERYADRVRKRARKIRQGAAERGIE